MRTSTRSMLVISVLSIFVASSLSALADDTKKPAKPKVTTNQQGNKGASTKGSDPSGNGTTGDIINNTVGGSVGNAVGGLLNGLGVK